MNSGLIFASSFLSIFIGGNLLVLAILWYLGKLPDSYDHRRRAQR